MGEAYCARYHAPVTFQLNSDIVLESCYFAEACEGDALDEWVKICQGPGKLVSISYFRLLHASRSRSILSYFLFSPIKYRRLYFVDKPSRRLTYICLRWSASNFWTVVAMWKRHTVCSRASCCIFPSTRSCKPVGCPYDPGMHTISYLTVRLYTYPSASKEWKDLWAAWDLVTLGMIPSDMLHQKPIDLRHKCLFYIGHIPTSVLIQLLPPVMPNVLKHRFLDMLMSRALNEPNTEPKYFTEIFEVPPIFFCSNYHS